MPDRDTREYVYRCRLCNGLVSGPRGCFNQTEGISVLIELLTKEAVFKPGAVIPRSEIHLCENGDIGVAELIGIRKTLE